MDEGPHQVKGGGGNAHDAVPTDDASAFARVDEAAVSIPRNALGRFGDVPAAYAVFRISFDQTAGNAIDAHYVYASPQYCNEYNLDQGSIVGRSYLELADAEGHRWLSQCDRVLASGETINDVVYSTLAHNWISYNLAPSALPGCCTFAFVIVDDESRGRKKMAVGGKTSRLITETLRALDGEHSYDAAMNGLADLIMKVMHPMRLGIYERGEHHTRSVLERRPESAPAKIDAIPSRPNDELEALYKALGKQPLLMVPDVSSLKVHNRALYDIVEHTGAHRFISVPFYSDGAIVGFMVAEDYRLEQKVDLKRLLSSISSFVGARIANKRLIDDLDWSGKHDGLTHLLNRQGIDMAVSEYRSTHPGVPYVLALFDLDDFKKVNDMYGHAAGDEALKACARRMHEAFPDNCILGRNGGDEFLVVLTGDSAERAPQLIDGFSKGGIDFTCRGIERHMTSSLGYARYPEQAQTQDELFTRADIALYAVKLAGKAGYKQFDPGMASQYRARLGFTPRDLAKNIPGSMIVYQSDEEGTILFVNDELVSLLECDDVIDLLELTDGSFWGMVHPDDVERVRREFSNQVAPDEVGGKNFSNFSVVTKSGAVKNVFENGRLVDLGDVGKAFYALLVDWGEYDVKIAEAKKGT